jgi:hypothetical protein
MRALRFLIAALILWAAFTLLHLSARGIGNHYFHLHLH